MPRFKSLTLTSLLALAIAAPSAFAQTGAQTGDKLLAAAPRTIPVIKAVPGDATAVPVGPRHQKKHAAKANRGADVAKAAPATPTAQQSN